MALSLRPARSPTVVRMTDRRLAIDAWESLFRAQHEVFDEISGDFDDTGSPRPSTTCC